MSNHKTIYMDFLKKRVSVQAVLGEIDRHMTAGKPDGKQRALALLPKLKTVLDAESQALGFYIQAIKGSGSRDGAAMSLSAVQFRALSQKERTKFLQAGGNIVS